MATKVQPVNLSAGEVAQIADYFHGMSDDEREGMSQTFRICLSIFVPAEDRDRAIENYKSLGLL